MTEAEDPRKRDDSIVGRKVECVIVDLYDAGGRVLAMPTDPEILRKAMEQGREFAFYKMQTKLPEELGIVWTNKKDWRRIISEDLGVSTNDLGNFPSFEKTQMLRQADSQEKLCSGC